MAAITKEEFHLEEYKQLKAEVSGLLARIETLARYSLLVSAVVYSWLAVQGIDIGENQHWCQKLPSAILSKAWYIPLIFTVLAALAAFAAYWRGREMGNYLKQLEKMLAKDGKAWEYFLETKASVLTYAGVAFWAVLLAANIFAGYRAGDFLDNTKDICVSSEKK